MAMADGRRMHDWNLTSSVIATLININKAKGKPQVKPSDINPMLAKQPQVTDFKDMRDLMGIKTRTLKVAKEQS